MLVSFVGPVAAGDVELSATVVRVGRSATQVSASISQAGSVGCAIMASFASSRPSTIQVPGSERPTMPGPEHSTSMPYIPGVVPSFARQFELTWAIDFVEPIEADPEAASDEWWAFAVDTDQAAGGWAHTRAKLWSPSGRLVATSSQTVAVFA